MALDAYNSDLLPTLTQPDSMPAGKGMTTPSLLSCSRTCIVSRARSRLGGCSRPVRVCSSAQPGCVRGAAGCDAVTAAAAAAVASTAAVTATGSMCRNYECSRAVHLVPGVPGARLPGFRTLLRSPAIAGGSGGSRGSGARAGGRRAAGGQLRRSVVCLLPPVRLRLLLLLRLHLRLWSTLLHCRHRAAGSCSCASTCLLLLALLLLLLLLPLLRSLVRCDSSAGGGADRTLRSAFGTLRSAGGVLPFPALCLLPLLRVRRRRQRLVPRRGRRRLLFHRFHRFLLPVHR